MLQPVQNEAFSSTTLNFSFSQVDRIKTTCLPFPYFFSALCLAGSGRMPSASNRLRASSRAQVETLRVPCQYREVEILARALAQPSQGKNMNPNPSLAILKLL